MIKSIVIGAAFFTLACVVAVGEEKAAPSTAPSTAPAPETAPVKKGNFLSRPFKDRNAEAMATLQALGEALRQYKLLVNKECGADYLNDFKAVPQCWKIINKLPPEALGKDAVLDPWGSKIIFNTAEKSFLPEGFFQSYGADKIPNNTDDLRNVEPR